jgi:TolB protein
LIDEQVAYQSACNGERVAEEKAELTGTILYSSQQGDSYHIFRLRLGAAPTSELLVSDASLPSLSPDGRSLALFNRQSGPGGLVVLDLSVRNSNDRSIRSEHAEDAQDSPPAWSPDSDRIAFASRRFGDGRSRIYVAPADVRAGATELSGGKDPAWRPDGDWIVYNGTDANGSRPGLWLMRADGSDKRQLTDNGNDQRPVWMPDGESILFMSNGRHGNWEVYRVDWTTGDITRLTYRDGSQDGLPAVSPDGKYFAYLSDEGGVWRIYYAPVEGDEDGEGGVGEGRLLSEMAGSLPSWLEHTIQWVP